MLTFGFYMVVDKAEELWHTLEEMNEIFFK